VDAAEGDHFLVGALGFASQLRVGRVEARIATRLRNRLHARLISLPLGWLDRRRVSELAALGAVDAEAAASFATRFPIALPPLVITAAGALVLMLRIDPVAGAAVCIAAPGAAWASRGLARPLTGLAARLAESQASLLAALHESLDLRLTVKVFGREAEEAARHRQAAESYRLAREAHLRRQLLIGPVNRWVTGCGATFVVALAALRAPLPAESLVTLLGSALLFSRPLAAAAGLHAQLQQARAAAERLRPIWEAPSERPSPGAVPRPARRDRPGAALSLRGVHFAHPGRPAILRGLDLEIAPGELVALVGLNGEGKTSLAHLLLRLHEPDAGTLLLDGQNLAALERSELRRSVGLVTQRTELFDRSLAENIAYGAPGARPDAIEAAARRAGAHDFIAALPEGYATRVGENGVQLSGGQRQRVALARAILHEPALLVLDEATALFDPAGERAFLEQNPDWLSARTVLWITHRRQSIRSADRVVQIRDGRAVELPWRRESPKPPTRSEPRPVAVPAPPPAT